jgi:hypothetical protein
MRETDRQPASEQTSEHSGCRYDHFAIFVADDPIEDDDDDESVRTKSGALLPPLLLLVVVVVTTAAR